MKDWNLPAPRFARFRVEVLPGKGHIVYDPEGLAVTQPDTAENAEIARATLQDAWNETHKIGERPCMCCGRLFESEGIHNRLCSSCRGRSDAPSSYGYAGSSSGRKPRRSSGA